MKKFEIGSRYRVATEDGTPMHPELGDTPFIIGKYLGPAEDGGRFEIADGRTVLVRNVYLRETEDND